MNLEISLALEDKFSRGKIAPFVTILLKSLLRTLFIMLLGEKMSFTLSSNNLWSGTGAVIGTIAGYGIAKSLVPETNRRGQLVKKPDLCIQRGAITSVCVIGFALFAKDLAGGITSAAKMSETCSLAEVALSISIVAITIMINYNSCNRENQRRKNK